jgi:hypothetical protein
MRGIGLGEVAVPADRRLTPASRTRVRDCDLRSPAEASVAGCFGRSACCGMARAGAATPCARASADIRAAPLCASRAKRAISFSARLIAVDSPLSNTSATPVASVPLIAVSSRCKGHSVQVRSRQSKTRPSSSPSATMKARRSAGGSRKATSKGTPFRSRNRQSTRSGCRLSFPRLASASRVRAVPRKRAPPHPARHRQVARPALQSALRW